MIMAKKPDPKVFYPNGKFHSEVADLMGISNVSLSTGITKGRYPFSDCRIKIGQHYIYDWDACLAKLTNK